ncbi:hypothetical protein UA08_06776 [Talaromyces atroroseus]|uniref:Uncharacterized protein n=1 Tax=Talaromyces atroroseus TaxID=1441469 RepID=A0A225AB66_TALAT|nr:hypothetical protein UA08_06776 [Talaromyces atroroseus]OKL58182.1 hypothetical protein UA08_06776 [Talaromyces atroroseus]
MAYKTNYELWCQHCNPINNEEPDSPSGSTTMSTFEGSEDGSDYLFTPTTNPTVDNGKRRKIRQRLRQLLKRWPRSNN